MEGEGREEGREEGGERGEERGGEGRGQGRRERGDMVKVRFGDIQSGHGHNCIHVCNRGHTWQQQLDTTRVPRPYFVGYWI